MKRLKVYLHAFALLILSVFFSWIIFLIRNKISFGNYIDPIYHLWLFGPTIASLVLMLLKKEDGIVNIGFRRIENSKVLYLSIIVLFIAIGLSRIIQYYLGFISLAFNNNSFFLFNHQFSPFLGSVIWILLLFIHSGFAEEFAWRGYLFSKIRNLSWIELVVLLNTIWALWHFPFMPFNRISQYILFWITCIEFGVILIYVRIKTNSVISSMVLHPLVVTFLGVFFIPYFRINNLDWAGWPNYLIIILFLPISIIYYIKGQKLHHEIIVR